MEFQKIKVSFFKKKIQKIKALHTFSKKDKNMRQGLINKTTW